MQSERENFSFPLPSLYPPPPPPSVYFPCAHHYDLLLSDAITSFIGQGSVHETEPSCALPQTIKDCLFICMCLHALPHPKSLFLGSKGERSGCKENLSLYWSRHNSFSFFRPLLCVIFCERYLFNFLALLSVFECMYPNLFFLCLLTTILLSCYYFTVQLVFFGLLGLWQLWQLFWITYFGLLILDYWIMALRHSGSIWHYGICLIL